MQIFDMASLFNLVDLVMYRIEQVLARVRNIFAER